MMPSLTRTSPIMALALVSGLLAATPAAAGTVAIPTQQPPTLKSPRDHATGQSSPNVGQQPYTILNMDAEI